jgi:hypothetical protein
MAREKIEIQVASTAFGELGAKQSQDKKPCRVMAKLPVRTVSVDYGLWSHPSLRSRCGSRNTAARPSLARVNLPPSIPARPFGLGWRFDRAPLVAPSSQGSISRQRLTHPRNAPSLAQIGLGRNMPAGARC